MYTQLSNHDRWKRRWVISRCVSYTTSVLHKYCILYITIDLKVVGMVTRPRIKPAKGWDKWLSLMNIITTL